MNHHNTHSNAQLAALLSESYREIEELRRRAPQDELRACLAALDEVRGRVVRLLGAVETTPALPPIHTNTNGNSLKRAVRPLPLSRLLIPPILKPPQRTDLPDPSPPSKKPTPPHRALSVSVSTPYPPTNDLNQRICRTCGQPGRYKDGKCVEKWGPGALGPGTVCDRCRKKIKRVERRATAKPIVPQLARNNLREVVSGEEEGEGEPEALEDLLVRAAGGVVVGGGGGREEDELMGSEGGGVDVKEEEEEEGSVKEELVDELLDAVDASEGR